MGQIQSELAHNMHICNANECMVVGKVMAYLSHTLWILVARCNTISLVIYVLKLDTIQIQHKIVEIHGFIRVLSNPFIKHFAIYEIVSFASFITNDIFLNRTIYLRPFIWTSLSADIDTISILKWTNICWIIT